MTNGNNSDTSPKDNVSISRTSEEEPYSEPSPEYASYFTITDRGICIDEPDHKDTTFEIRPEGVPSNGVPSIDFFYGRPVLYMYEPEKEEVQYMLALPTTEDPNLRPIQLKNRYFEDVTDRLKNGYYENQDEESP